MMEAFRAEVVEITTLGECGSTSWRHRRHRGMGPQPVACAVRQVLGDLREQIGAEEKTPLHYPLVEQRGRNREEERRY
jgi:hypothetical protein